MKKIFNALPAYLGGKRRLAPLIFSALNQVIPRDNWQGMTFIDPFLGGGSMSLLAKAHGFKVWCADIALRSVLVGKAVIENSGVRLSELDVMRGLREPPGPYPHLAESRYWPHVFNLTQAQAIDRTLAWMRLGYFDETKSALLSLLLIKAVLRCQPMSLLTGTDAEAAASGDYDRVSSRRVGHYLRNANVFSPDRLWQIAQDINAGIFAGQGHVKQADAVEFLSLTSGDVVYLDPPYPGTSDYESAYSVLDDLLERTARPVSTYSSASPPLPALFEACGHIPVWLVSLGGPNVDLEKVLPLLRSRHTRVEVYQIRYSHLKSLRKEKQNENKEYILIAW